MDKLTEKIEEIITNMDYVEGANAEVIAEHCKKLALAISDFIKGELPKEYPYTIEDCHNDIYEFGWNNGFNACLSLIKQKWGVI